MPKTDIESDEERQERLRAAGAKFVGSIEGNDPGLAENARAEVRARIVRRHGLDRRHPSRGGCVRG